VIGHRGAAGCAPENTLAGFHAAKRLGCQWVEFDVRLTADGQLVLRHDEQLRGATDGRGRVGALRLADIRRYDAGGWFGPAFAGERVPSLQEALDTAAELGLGANVELKAARGRGVPTAMAAAEALRSRFTQRPQPCLVSSFDLDMLAVMRETAPAVARAALFRWLPRDWEKRVAGLACCAVNLGHRRLRPVDVAAVNEAGYRCFVYTVNDARRALELFGWGVAGVFSDNPDVIIAALAGGVRQTVAGDGCLAGDFPLGGFA
jgi:glycerophosphoryl diester phosphodiesterase